MKQNTYDSLQVQEDGTIDLRELFNILQKRKKLIYFLTILITLCTIVYVYTIKPIYEVKVSMELGQINKEPVQSIKDLKQKIEIIYEIDNKEIELPKITHITLPKNTNNIIKINAQGYTNDTVKEKLQSVMQYISSLQDKELNSYVSLQEKKLQLTEEDIKNNIQTIVKISEDKKKYVHKLLNISEQDAALAGIYTIEIGKKETELNNISSRINSLKNQKNQLKFSISPLNIKRASIIGKIEIHDKPIKPKKILIIIVSFITALMLSIFLAFFLEFLRGIKEE